ncbi:MAG: hypothetical protein SGCHY_005038, partial [Lobulomycetales sp.]
VMFTPVIQHPNIWSSGDVCLSILDSTGWKPSLSVKQILLGLQELLVNPNPKSPANVVCNKLFVKNPRAYSEQCKREAARLKPVE